VLKISLFLFDIYTTFALEIVFIMNKLELIEALEVEKDELLSRVKSLEHTILTLKQSLNFDGSSLSRNGKGDVSKANGTVYEQYKSYHAAKGNKEKATEIFKGAGKFLHMRQIVKIAQSLEPKTDPDVVKGRIQQGVYALKNLDNSPIVNKIINGSNLNAFWGSKNWLDEKGNIKPEHMYDEKELSSNKNEPIEI
jgi:hypothetical protein